MMQNIKSPGYYVYPHERQKSSKLESGYGQIWSDDLESPDVTF